MSKFALLSPSSLGGSSNAESAIIMLGVSVGGGGSFTILTETCSVDFGIFDVSSFQLSFSSSAKTACVGGAVAAKGLSVTVYAILLWILDRLENADGKAVGKAVGNGLLVLSMILFSLPLFFLFRRVGEAVGNKVGDAVGNDGGAGVLLLLLLLLSLLLSLEYRVGDGVGAGVLLILLVVISFLS